jgi:hypothetical protein
LLIQVKGSAPGASNLVPGRPMPRRRVGSIGTYAPFMELNAFITRCTLHCAAYFEAVRLADATGRLALLSQDGKPIRPQYPTMLLICQTPTHFAAELLGVSAQFPVELEVITRTLPSIDSILGKFPSASTKSLVAFPPGGRGIGLSHLALLCQQDDDVFRQRYPELPELHETGLIYGGPLGPDEAFHPLDLPPDYSDLWLDDVLMLASWHGRVRARYFQAAWLIERTASSSELQRRLRERHPIGADTSLLPTASEANRSLVLSAANFASLAAMDRIGETTITKFLEVNEPILLMALDGVRLIPQPRLKWIEGNPSPDELAIQPDFLLVDAEGRGHICEVKLPLLDRTTLTTGGHKRRKFISAVSDGIAQLANYREYFSFASHRQLLTETYGITIEEPRSILLVGSSENYDPEEDRQAQRMLRPFDLLDYDTLRALFLLKSGYVPRGGVSAP